MYFYEVLVLIIVLKGNIAVYMIKLFYIFDIC